MSFDPQDLSWQVPLLTEEGRQMIIRLREHADAPRWNVYTGDRLYQQDLDALKEYKDQLSTNRTGYQPGIPPQRILNWVQTMDPRVPLFARNIPRKADPAKEWSSIKRMSREDIALRLSEVVPEDADLDRLIKYGTSGTTGHPIMVPHEPRAVAHYQVFIEHVLNLYGIIPDFNPGVVAAFEVCAQLRTVTFATVLSFWNQAGFAKVNLNPSDWPEPESMSRYFEEMSPLVLTGDPVSFARMIQLEIPAKPLAMISTALALTPTVKRVFQNHFQCPLIDWYSLNETGPIGYSCIQGNGYHVLPHDIYVEAVDEDGIAVPIGERGEITITGGRNPYVPLLRYRTGDWGKLGVSPCSCGDPMPRIVELEGREPVLFLATNGKIVNPVDISRMLGNFPVVQHRFIQHGDSSCELTLRLVPGTSSTTCEPIKDSLREMFGQDLRLTVHFDPTLGDTATGEKVIAYQSEMGIENV